MNTNQWMRRGVAVLAMALSGPALAGRPGVPHSGEPTHIRACAAVAATTVASPSGHVASPPVAKLVTPASELKLPFDRYTTTDEFGREITFYLSVANYKPNGPKEAPKDADTKDKSETRDAATSGPTDTDAKDRPLPIAVFIQGSGGGSLFGELPDGRRYGGIQNILLTLADGRFRVLCVEKPGVAFLSQATPPGSAEGCTDEFKREHTPERWAAAIVAATRAARALPGIDTSTLLVSGHSEGGDMAAHVGAAMPEATHVAILSAGGPTQLFDMAQLARREQSPGESDADREARVESAYEAWARIMQNPDSIEKSEWGHPNRRWSTFMKAGPVQSALACNAKMFLAYGTLDTSVPVESCDVLRAQLTAAGKDVTTDRRIGEDHGYSKEGQDPRAGFTIVFTKMIEWWKPSGEGK
ncbi:MAG: prolyl oligopeptidase family serine peptidase [Phycisphaerales bacterium]|nr:prolyl oligopeptidase family serine peptidase [Phycisphaerales bacterium]